MSKRLTTREFIERARRKHGNEYDYSKSNYIGSNAKLTIICKIHGPFKQTPHNHLLKYGCFKCGIKKQKLTKKQFMEKASKIHNDKYDYSKFKYINYKTKGIIICKTHGPFSQVAGEHLRGHGCSGCGIKNGQQKSTLTKKQFIEKARKTHNDKYDYSKSDYMGSNTKLTIICKIHGPFKQRADSHLYGNGCFKCGVKSAQQKSTLTTEEFINKASKVHNNKYDYSKFNYKNSLVNGIIICKIHGEFEQLPNNHLMGRGCPECGIEKQRKEMAKTIEEFIKEAEVVHNNKYNYSKSNYINNKIKLTIICPFHGKFKQSPNHHLGGAGCSKCVGTISKTETKWLDILEKEQNIKIERNKTIYIRDKRFKADGFHGTTNTWYEYNGYYWHGHPNYYKPQDIHPLRKVTFNELYQKTLEKEKLIKQAGYNLVAKWGD